MTKQRVRNRALVLVAGVSLMLVGAIGCSSAPNGDDASRYGGQMVRVQGGFDGPATRGDWQSAKASPEVMCGLEDVSHDDIGEGRDEEVRQGNWRDVRPDRPGRCGDDYETLMFRLTNCERQARGLPPLQCDMRLVWAARAHSLDMNERQYFSHDAPDGTDPGQRMDARGINWQASAENLAMSPTMALAHTGWMESRGHRTNILDGQFSHMGVGAIKTERGYLLTALFLTPP